MTYSKIQNDIINYLDTQYDVRSIEGFDLVGGEVVAEVTAFDGIAYTRFNIMPDGFTNVFNYVISAQHVNKLNGNREQAEQVTEAVMEYLYDAGTANKKTIIASICHDKGYARQNVSDAIEYLLSEGYITSAREKQSIVFSINRDVIDKQPENLFQSNQTTS